MLTSMMLCVLASSATFEGAPTREARFQGALVAQADLPPPPPPQVAPATVDTTALQAELNQLLAHRPTVGGPVGLLIGGGVAFVVGVVLVALGWPLIGIVIGLPIMALGALVGIAGVVLAIIGAAQLPGRIAAVHRTNRRIQELERALAVPPTGLLDVAPTLQLAAF